MENMGFEAFPLQNQRTCTYTQYVHQRSRLRHGDESLTSQSSRVRSGIPFFTLFDFIIYGETSGVPKFQPKFRTFLPFLLYLLSELCPSGSYLQPFTTQIPSLLASYPTYHYLIYATNTIKIFPEREHGGKESSCFLWFHSGQRILAMPW